MKRKHGDELILHEVNDNQCSFVVKIKGNRKPIAHKTW